MDQLLEGFLTRLNATSSSEESWMETLAFFEHLGFPLASYGYTAGGAGGAEFEGVVMNNYASDYHDHYEAEGYAKVDPSVIHCLTNLVPRHIGVDGGWPDLDPIQSRLINEAGEVGLRTGLVFPMRLSGRFGFAGLSISNSMGREEFDRFLVDRKMVAHLAAMYAHTRIQMQLTGEQAAQFHLTSREREVLLWMARGLPSKVAAYRLGISSKTVELHLSGARKKLGAATSAHAVARAIAFNLISP